MRRARRARQSGVALIAVLWLLVILGLLSSALLTSTHFDVLATSNERCRLQASYAAQAGVADATEQLDRWLAVAQVAARGGTPQQPRVSPDCCSNSTGPSEMGATVSSRWT